MGGRHDMYIEEVEDKKQKMIEVGKRMRLREKALLKEVSRLKQILSEVDKKDSNFRDYLSILSISDTARLDNLSPGIAFPSGAVFDRYDYKIVKNEVMASYMREDLDAFNSFEEFFNHVDVSNAYEEFWEVEKEKWKLYYELVFSEYKRTNWSIPQWP